MRVLVVGANGYTGGRLVPRLIEAGHTPVLATRRPESVAPRFPDLRLLRLAPVDPAALAAAVRDVDVVASFQERVAGPADPAWAEDLALAWAVGSAVAEANAADGVGRRILHLSKLGLAGARDRTAFGEVAAALASGGAPVLELRAAPILGAGSLTFDLVRHLVEKTPVIVLAPWMRVDAQPVSIRDVLDAFLGALAADRTGVVELGGPDRLTVADMLTRYADLRGLQRLRLRLPLGGGASDRWVSLVSPLPVTTARLLRERFTNGTIVDDPVPALSLGIHPTGYEEELRIALARTEGNRVETTWHDSLGRSHALLPPELLDAAPGAVPPTPDLLMPERRWLLDRRTIEVPAPPEAVFAQVERLGGDVGWPAGNVFWRIRGLMDRMVGGVGMRLGRRDRERLRVGDAVDFWRVEAVDRPRLLRLRAEMRVPGLAWLQYDVEPTATGSRLVQTAYFDPHGLGGYAYWYCLLPVHIPIFIRMVQVLSGRAVSASRATA